MAEFYYKARTIDGRITEGKATCDTEHELSTMLRNDGMFPIEIVALETTLSYSLLTMFSGWFAPRIDAETLYMFSRQMYSLCKAGVTLSRAIIKMSETAKNPVFSKALKELAEDLARGLKLATSMKNHPNIFPPLMVSIVSIGEENGKLDESFLQISNYIEMEDQTVKQLKTLFRYPIFVVSAVIIALVVINMFVIPNFARLFASFQTKLPLPTIILITFSDFMVHYWPVIFTAIFVIFIGTRHYIRTPKGKIWWSKLFISLPILGPISKSILLTRFTKSFAIVSRADIPINQGIILVSNAIDNAYLKDKMLHMHNLIDRGEKLTYAAKSVNVFSPLVLQMLEIGEETGDFATVMEEVSDFYNKDIEYRLKKVTATIESILLILSALLVLILALGVFLPMWDIVNFAKH